MTGVPQPKIAHYLIVSKLGEGGMGAVYRATDTKLNREVAVKVLPEAFAADPERFARFTREAQVLAQLNHPHIAAIYGVEDCALVLELVEGPTLADRIATGPLPVDEALPIARQIAEALEYAHEKGIIHRDLKPANIKTTPEGNVKILDFGLAKALSNDAPAPGSASSATLTMQATVAGIIMGTPGYMSPEQARGKPADRRADIWAFGVVLYEMLTGRAMYAGETVSDTLASVLKDQPSLHTLPPETPPHIRALLARSLEKDPRKRLQAIGEARIAIEEAPAAPSPAVLTSPPAPAPSRWPWAVAGLATGLAIAAAGWIALTPRPEPRPWMRFSVDMGPAASLTSTNSIAISPDGTRVAYPVWIDGRGLMAVRSLNDPKPAVLAGTEATNYPFFSPDGEWIGFASLGQLSKISITGGSRLVLCPAPNLRGATWSDDGNIYASLNGTEISRIPASGGTPQVLSRQDNPAQPMRRLPWALPGGAGLLFTTLPSGDLTANAYKSAEVDLLLPKSGEVRTLVRGGLAPVYLTSGHLLYQIQNTLFAVRFDAGRLQVQGSPVPLLDDVSPITGTPPVRQFDISRTGTLVYLSGKSTEQVQPLVWLDASASRPLVASPPGRIETPRISPDGKRVAASVSGDIWVFDPERGVSTRLTTGVNASYPVWTPDGKAIAFMSSAPAIGWVPADGSAPPQILLQGSGRSPIPQSFSPDGRVLAFHQGIDSVAHRVIFTIDLDTSRSGLPKAGQPRQFLEAEGAAADPMFSPDGRWIAYLAGPLGSYHVFVGPAPGADGEGQAQVSTESGRFPMWSRTAKEIFYVTNDGHILVVPYTVQGRNFVPGKPRQWSQQAIELNGVYYPIDLAPDGKTFAATLAQNDASGKTNLHLSFVLNFMDEVKRRLP